jgi:manganese-dependent inorganic pyrophosphatase
VEKLAANAEPVLNLPGVVSRKKQLIPELMMAEQE